MTSAVGKGGLKRSEAGGREAIREVMWGWGRMRAWPCEAEGGKGSDRWDFSRGRGGVSLTKCETRGQGRLAVAAELPGG